MDDVEVPRTQLELITPTNRTRLKTSDYPVGIELKLTKGTITVIYFIIENRRSTATFSRNPPNPLAGQQAVDEYHIGGIKIIVFGDGAIGLSWVTSIGRPLEFRVQPFPDPRAEDLGNVRHATHRVHAPTIEEDKIDDGDTTLTANFPNTEVGHSGPSTLPQTPTQQSATIPSSTTGSLQPQRPRSAPSRKQGFANPVQSPPVDLITANQPSTISGPAMNSTTVEDAAASDPQRRKLQSSTTEIPLPTHKPHIHVETHSFPAIKQKNGTPTLDETAKELHFAPAGSLNHRDPEIIRVKKQLKVAFDSSEAPAYRLNLSRIPFQTNKSFIISCDRAPPEIPHNVLRTWKYPENYVGIAQGHAAHNEVNVEMFMKRLQEAVSTA